MRATAFLPLTPSPDNNGGVWSARRRQRQSQAVGRTSGTAAQPCRPGSDPVFVEAWPVSCGRLGATTQRTREGKVTRPPHLSHPVEEGMTMSAPIIAALRQHRQLKESVLHTAQELAPPAPRSTA